MKRFIFGATLVILSIYSGTWAMDAQAGDSYFLQPGDSVQDDLLYFGRYLEVNGYVQSDVYFFGEELVLNGHIGDDVLVFGRKAILSGEITGNVFFFGQILELKGVVHGSVRAMGQQLTLLPGARVKGDVFMGGKRISINQAQIDGGFKGGAGEIVLNGTIQKGVQFEGGDVAFGPRFRSRGKVVVTLHQKKSEAIPNAPANLELHYKTRKPFYQRPVSLWLGVSAFIVGLLFVAAFPGANWEMVNIARHQSIKTIGIGALFVIVFPVVALLLIIVPPLTFIFGAFYLTLLYLSKMLGASVLGQILLQQWGKNQNRYLGYALGFVVLSLIGLIPVVGSLVIFIMAFLAVGALLQVMWQQYHKAMS